MAFTIEAYQKSRPFLFHLTGQRNIGRIRRTRFLQSAAALFAAAGDGAMIDRKRTDIHEIVVDGEIVSIRDQAPLYQGNIRFQGGWMFADLVRHLNEHVFFWPGSKAGPISYGVRHFERYRDEAPILLRVRYESLAAVNLHRTPLFCKFNSGSPRCSRGIGSLRGPTTFIESASCDFTPGKVVEVTYHERAILPGDVEIANSPSGHWTRLFDA